MPRILIIDDVSDNVEMLRQYLIGLDFEVLCAKSDTKIIEKIDQTEPDLILLNMAISSANGLEICRRIKEHDPEHFHPVLLISINNDIQSKISGLSAGADDYVTTPLNMEEMTARIKSFLRIKSKYDALYERVKRLQDQSLIDNLTRLYNQRYFLERLEVESSRKNRYGQPYSIILLEIDNFVSINDKMSSNFAEQIFQRLASLFLKTVRQTDIVAKFDGARFAILLADTKDALPTAERIRMIIESNDFPYDGKSIKLTISAGLCAVPSSSKIPFEKVLELADQALYNAVEAGRNRISQIQVDEGFAQNN